MYFMKAAKKNGSKFMEATRKNGINFMGKYVQFYGGHLEKYV